MPDNTDSHYSSDHFGFNPLFRKSLPKGKSAETAWTTYDLKEGAPKLIPGDFYSNSVIPGCSNTKSEDWEKSATHDCSRYIPK